MHTQDPQTDGDCARVWTWNSLPRPNFVKIIQGIRFLGKIVTKKKSKCFAILNYLSPHFYTYEVEILLQRMDL